MAPAPAPRDGLGINDGDGERVLASDFDCLTVVSRHPTLVRGRARPRGKHRGSRQEMAKKNHYTGKRDLSLDARAREDRDGQK